MEFKDKIIEKLQNELDECIEYRCRTGQRNLELVSATLSNSISYIQQYNWIKVSVCVSMPLFIEKASTF